MYIHSIPKYNTYMYVMKKHVNFVMFCCTLVLHKGVHSFFYTYVYVRIYSRIRMIVCTVSLYEETVRTVSLYVPFLRTKTVRTVSSYIPFLRTYRFFVHTVSSYIPFLRTYRFFVHTVSLYKETVRTKKYEETIRMYRFFVQYTCTLYTLQLNIYAVNVVNAM